MAGSEVQAKVEEWVRDEWMPQHYGQSFRRRPVALTTGGEHSFSAVSEDGRTVVKISTGSRRTAGGKLAVGVLSKLRADLLFMTLTDAKQKLVLVTQPDMYELCQIESAAGRVPLDVDFVQVELPEELAEELRKAKARASAEVTPRGA